MILGKSNHPVELKKIKLNLWKLRDEIEATIENHLNLEGSEKKEDVLNSIKSYYIKGDNAQVVQLKPKAAPKAGSKTAAQKPGQAELDELSALVDLEHGEDEGEEVAEDSEENTEADAGAEAKADAEDTEEQESSEEEDEEFDAEAAMAAAMEEGEKSDSEDSEEELDAEAAMAAAMEEGEESGNDEEFDAEAAMAAALKEEAAQDNNVVAFPGASSNQIQTQELQRFRPPKEKISLGYTLLADIYMDEIMLYSREEFRPGQALVIEFLVPKQFTIKAEIIYVRNIALNSRIISDTKPHFRLKSRFIFDQPGKRTALREFIKSFTPEIKVVKKSVKKEEKDELDELDF
jgi:hypothetical protein